MAFPAGVSGNPGGRPKSKLFREALLLVLNEEIDDCGTNKKKLRKLAEVLVGEGISGDVSAANAVMDRVDGKVPQAQIHQGDEDGGPVNHAVSVTFHKPGETNG